MEASFEITDGALRKLIEFSNISKGHVVLFLPIAILARTTLAFLGGIEDQFRVLKDIFACCILVVGFLSYLNFVVEAPQFFADKVGISHIEVNVSPDRGNFFALDIAVISKSVGYFCYGLAVLVYRLSLMLLAFLSGYIILATTMTSSYGSLLVYCLLLLLVGLMPVFWGIINLITQWQFDPDDAAWNNLMILFSSIAKGLLTVMIGKKALWEPFLSKGVAAASSFLGMGAKGIALASGGGALAKATYAALGGEKHIEKVSEKINNLKQFAKDSLKKTIPTIERASIAAGTPVVAGIARHAPSMVEATKRASSYFRDKKSPYNGEVLTGSSPFIRTLKSNSSLNRPTLRSHSAKADESSVSKETNSVGNIVPYLKQSKTIPNNVTPALKIHTPNAVIPLQDVPVSPATHIFGTDYKKIPSIRQVTKFNSAAYGGIMDTSNSSALPQKYIVSGRTYKENQKPQQKRSR